MSVVATPEIKGTFQEFPFAELLTEVSQAGLSGSFRLAHHETKAIIYVNNGEVVFAVSNLRQHRLYQVLLQNNLIDKESLAQIPDFTNDMKLSEVLIGKNILTEETANAMFSQQIIQIITEILQWQTGAWSFSHLAKAKEGLNYQIDLKHLLIEYARNLPDDSILKRYKNFDEKFIIKNPIPQNITLLPLEGFVLSRLTNSLVKAQDIKTQCGLSNIEVLRSLYVLWLGSFAIRNNWQSAFSETQVKDILSAKLTLKKAAIAVNLDTEPVEDEVLELPTEEVFAFSEEQLLQKYLKQVETAESYYEILAVPPKATISELKVAYFNLAKKYHPDRFHQEVDKDLQQRVQNAFSEIARAYDTLKDDKARELYDFKLRKYLETLKERKPVEVNKTGSKVVNQEDRAKEEFDQGFDFLMNQQSEEALPFLARAVQMSPKNARYHAYFGKALSIDANQRFKAESEIREAMKLDAQNVSYRIMLAEFYIQFNLLKRAEGELQRLLVQFPNNREAEVLLDSLANK